MSYVVWTRHRGKAPHARLEGWIESRKLSVRLFQVADGRGVRWILSSRDFPLDVTIAASQEENAKTEAELALRIRFNEDG